MAIRIVFETHSTSTDNEVGVASGWADSRLSERGRLQAREMGERRRDDRISVVLCSDLRRAVETIEIAFEDTVTNRLLDWRLRECDYGDMTRMPVDDLHREMTQHVDDPYPGGESWRQAVLRVSKVFDDIATRWSGERVLIVGHRATRWALDHVVAGVPLEDLVQEDFDWRAGWEYRLQP